MTRPKFRDSAPQPDWWFHKVTAILADMDHPTDTWSHCLEHAALSDIGLRRANNQDSYCVALAGDQGDFERRGHLLIVADGMGAHAAGELASKIAADVVSLTYRKLLDQSPPEAVLSAVLEANRQIHTRGQASPDFRGMGTTTTALLLLPAGALVAHVGDSRAYRLRGSRIEQLTFDHSLVWEMQASGHSPEAEAAGYISKNIITRSLGPSPTVQVDLEGPFQVQAGDTFLLCSDGLSNQVKDDEIGMVLGCLPPAEAAQTLIDLACLRGGPDNITAVVARVLGPQVAQAGGSDQPASSVAANVRPIHPLVWTLLGAASLAAVGLLMLEHPAMALISLLVAVGAGAAALQQRYGGGRKSELDRRRFGRGPYVQCDAAPNSDLLARLAEIVRQLRDASMSENWAVDWARFDGLLAQSTAAARSGDLAAAARANLRAISSIMAHLRKQRPAGSDSGVFTF
ncbi:MAG: protein phosphatase 2C domain-containing protein [Planctomycetes bacterium]|nr:protein phosphatase 2C domain-containing protein [Planctomycetota bacterium]MCG2683436.1 protein phosphatase 2C domain-containing protein [Planctomycetales bacterium]